MPRLTIELPARADQTAFNIRRWSELLADRDLGRNLARVQGRIETDRHGHIIMYPPAAFAHGSYQSEIAHLLREKKAIYFAAGAQEVWFCDRAGRMTFHVTAESPGATNSVICPDFPTRVKV